MSDPDIPTDESSASHESSPDSPDTVVDPGPGCLPGVVAATLIMSMMFFIGCGISAYVIFGKRTELAIRSLENSYIPLIEQSRLLPEEKEGVIEQLNVLVVDMKADKLENWQSSGVMQRLVRLPVVQWGEVRAVEKFAQKQGGQLGEDATLHLSRLRRAVEENKVTSMDLEDILKTVKVADPATGLTSLVNPLTTADVAEAVNRARIAADQCNIPDQTFSDVSIEAIVRRQIEAGIASGTY